MQYNEHPHRRYNPLTGEWILVSPHRTKRPWQGKKEEPQQDERPSYDPACYLCPGNSRAGGAKTPEYTSTYVFENDFAALLPHTPHEELNEGGLLRARTEQGICRVICFSPRHDLTLPRMSSTEVRAVVDVWIDQYTQLSKYDALAYVQIFENRGAVMGCSNPHPHGQIWCNQSVPYLPMLETRHQQEYYSEQGSCLLCDYCAREVALGERIVYTNDDFVVLVPFWAVWPYEVMVLPRRHAGSIDQLTQKERGSLAALLKVLGVRYDNLFETSFPYSMGIHQSPCDGQVYAGWHWHMHYYPPLLRSASVKKFMVGYEMLGQPQRDITAEQSAQRLAQLSDTHYLDS